MLYKAEFVNNLTLVGNVLLTQECRCLKQVGEKLIINYYTMKKTIFFTLCLSAFITFSAAAKIWRVNNNPGVNADFTDVQAAHNAAVAGDTIHVEPSSVSYGNLDVSKKLIILGSGYFLDQNINLQAYPISSQINSVIFRNGSDNSVFSGFSVGSINVAPESGLMNVDIPLQNITISRNVTFSISVGTSYSSALNIVIKQNYIQTGGSGSRLISFSGYAGYPITGSIYNNYCSVIQFNLSSNYPLQSGAVISNNTVESGIYSSNSVIKNNIITNSNYTINTNDPNFPNTISNNIYAGVNGPLGSGDLYNVDMSTVFVGSTGYTTDSQWQLKAGSPAIGAGANSEDCGMFGGANPYKLSGLPAIPSIYSLSTAASNTTTLPVTISVKSNN